MESKNQIIWLLKGAEVGRCNLPEGTIEKERLELAFEAGIKEYDDFLMTDKNGAVYAKANSVTFEGQGIGKISGKGYEEYLKQKQDGHSKEQ